MLAPRINEVLSMDFVFDSSANGWHLKCPTVADGFTHECVHIAADDDISGEYLTRLLDRVATFRCYSTAVKTDFRHLQYLQQPQDGSRC